MNSPIYILKLEHDSWYVGTAKGLRSRLRSHAKKNPLFCSKKRAQSANTEKGLTGKRKATHLHAAFRLVGNSSHLTELETCITVAMANKYGFHKVRGGTFITPWNTDINPSLIETLNTEFGHIDIRPKFNLVEIDLKTEKPFVFPLTNRKNS